MLKKNMFTKTELEQGEKKKSSYFLHPFHIIFTSRQEANSCKKKHFFIFNKNKLFFINDSLVNK